MRQEEGRRGDGESGSRGVLTPAAAALCLWNTCPSGWLVAFHVVLSLAQLAATLRQQRSWEDDAISALLAGGIFLYVEPSAPACSQAGAVAVHCDAARRCRRKQD